MISSNQYLSKVIKNLKNWPSAAKKCTDSSSPDLYSLAARPSRFIAEPPLNKSHSKSSQEIRFVCMFSLVYFYPWIFIFFLLVCFLLVVIGANRQFIKPILICYNFVIIKWLKCEWETGQSERVGGVGRG